jgi:hypothetical protein
MVVTIPAMGSRTHPGIGPAPPACHSKLVNIKGAIGVLLASSSASSVGRQRPTAGLQAGDSPRDRTTSQPHSGQPEVSTFTRGWGNAQPGRRQVVTTATASTTVTFTHRRWHRVRGLPTQHAPTPIHDRRSGLGPQGRVVHRLCVVVDAAPIPALGRPGAQSAPGARRTQARAVG